MTDDTLRSEADGPVGTEAWDSPTLVGHGLLSEITLDSGAGFDDLFGDNGTANPS